MYLVRCGGRGLGVEGDNLTSCYRLGGDYTK